MLAIEDFSDLLKIWVIVFGFGLLLTPLLSRFIALLTFLDIRSRLLKKAYGYFRIRSTS